MVLALVKGAWAADDPAVPKAASTDTEDNNFYYQTKMTKEGLIFRVPEDMPIERRGGLQVPMQFDEYMYGKFRQLDNVLKDMQARLDRIEKLLTEMKEEQAKRKLAA